MAERADGSFEIIRPPQGRAFRFVLFDFDGTISLIREGWPDVMVPMMVEHLLPLDTGRTAQELHALMSDDVAETTGKQTIYQMIHFAERVREFGGQPLDPREYKAEYNRRLLDHIRHRREALAEGRAQPDDMLLAGARELLEELAGRGLLMCLASGTDQQYVLDEARLVDVAKYFGEHIYGALADYKSYSKAMVIERLIRENGIEGEQLVVFGDGFVEIENTRSVGGYAVGVASDESAGGGKVDQWKRERLLRAGADMIIPDFAACARLVGLLFGEQGT